jgi:hypothetical protein
VHTEEVDVQANRSPNAQPLGVTAQSMQHQPAALVQMQQPTGQNQMVNFGTSDHIPLLAIKIAQSQ